MTNTTSLISEEELKIKLEKSPGKRVTKEYIESRIQDIMYDVHPGTTLTRCIIVLDNNFIVTGESACVDPRNFDEEIGQKIAYDNAFRKLWPLFGFLLAENDFQSINL